MKKERERKLPKIIFFTTLSPLQKMPLNIVSPLKLSKIKLWKPLNFSFVRFIDE